MLQLCLNKMNFINTNVQVYIKKKQLSSKIYIYVYKKPINIQIK